MQYIDSITYNYLQTIQQQKQKNILYNIDKHLNTIYSTNNKNIINNFAQIIYEQALQRYLSKYNIIFESNNITNNLLLEEINVIQKEIIIQGAIDWIKEKASKVYDKGKQVVKKGVNAIKSGTSAVGDFIVNTYNKTGQIVKAGYNKAKEIAAKAWDSIKNLGAKIVEWFKAMIQFIKQGFGIIPKFVAGKNGFNSPDDCTKTCDTLVDSSKKAVPFLQPMISGSGQKLGNQNKDKVEKIQETMKNGGNIDKQMQSIKKSIQSSTQSIAKQDLDKCKNESQKFSKNLSKQVKNNKAEKTNNTNNTNNQENDDLIFEGIFAHNLKQFIIECVYKGITPKMLFSDNQIQQKDIIIDNCLLKFKTHAGDLICEQTNLLTKNTIIYQSNTSFRGKHLIFEETQNKFIKNRIITQQQQQETNKIISEAIPWIKVIMIGGIALSIFMGLKALWTAISAILAASTVGAGGAASEAGNAAATPAQSATGTVGGTTAVGNTAGTAGNVASSATQTATQTAAKETAKISLKEQLKNFSAKNAAKGLYRDPNLALQTGNNAYIGVSGTKAGLKQAANTHKMYTKGIDTGMSKADLQIINPPAAEVQADLAALNNL